MRVYLHKDLINSSDDWTTLPVLEVVQSMSHGFPFNIPLNYGVIMQNNLSL